MNILLLGSGGREHAFAWKITQSPLCEKLFIAPGNAGTAKLGINLNVNPNDFDAVKKTVLDNEIKMVIVGPEEPLVRGIYDFFQQDADLNKIALVGPSGEGAKLEGSKAYGKVFMAENNIPTAAYQEFTSENIEAGVAYIATQTPPIVLKADGLAAGKGVLILDNIEEAQTEFRAMLGGKFGDAGSKVVIEEFLDGIEFSVFVLSDGTNYVVLPTAKDYKRVSEGDKGLNTGGMGAVSPIPFVTEALMQEVDKTIIKPTVEGLKKDNITYEGFIYIGLIVVDGKPKVIEYNCRMGDPETQVAIPLLDNDLVDLFIHTGNGTLDQTTVKTKNKTAVTVVVASNGYPESYPKGVAINNIETKEDSIIFHAGTKMQDGQLVSSGGRVLTVTSFGENIKETAQKSFDVIEKMDFETKYYRKDIGHEFY